jgi:hypothetical protein
MKIRQIWLSINNVLTIINLFLIGILTFGNIPKKYQDKKIPFAANIVLLVVLIFTLSSYFIS